MHLTRQITQAKNNHPEVISLEPLISQEAELENCISELNNLREEVSFLGYS